ncbi:hypothetical protein BCR34DRAFT_475752 [Clohesyomyces aquaticus]|uniref:Rhodopsin domain-containing protein n=1 Tax=Clohesyomyces aquaticus TaxID=1231657 RepID=A0A1Y2A2U4_9PLEO|nr:hypothetical protein BCR34DRAFT_475752 [Clohesyomyces aquaticus]
MSMTPTPADIASWPKPNFVDPETRRPLILGVEIPLCTLVITFTVMRFYSRMVLIRALGADDWFMLAATVFSVGTSIMTCVSTLPTYQTGYHIWDLRPEIAANPVQTAQYSSIGIFPSRANKHFCNTLLCFVTAWATLSFFMALFQCNFWLIAQYPDRKCIDLAPLYYTTGCLNIISDFLIFLWPAKDLARIKISLKQRVTLIAMFSLGVVICVAGICRVWYTSVYLHSYDALSCKPLMAALIPHVFTSTHSSTHKSSRKKASNVAGQSFPFQSLNGGIVKEEGYCAEYGDAKDGYHSEHPTTNVTVHRARQDADAVSADSQEWIMMQDNPRDAEGQRIKSGV